MPIYDPRYVSEVKAHLTINFNYWIKPVYDPRRPHVIHHFYDRRIKKSITRSAGHRIRASMKYWNRVRAIKRAHPDWDMAKCRRRFRDLEIYYELEWWDEYEATRDELFYP
jgi:hypothetical protein